MKFISFIINNLTNRNQDADDGNDDEKFDDGEDSVFHISSLQWFSYFSHRVIFREQVLFIQIKKFHLLISLVNKFNVRNSKSFP